MIGFFVPGIPVTQGSMRSLGTGRPSVHGNAKILKPWRADVKLHASRAIEKPLEGALCVQVAFDFCRPKSHFRAGGQLKPVAPRYCLVRKDLDKLVRAILDALTGVAYLDDSQVAMLGAQRRWADRPGAWISVQRLGDTVIYNERG